jgi:uroporphyrinogen decarboxylase
MQNAFQPLSRDEVIRTIERRNPSRIPMILAKWWGHGLPEQHGDRLKDLDRYPEDVAWLWTPNPIEPLEMNLSWEWDTTVAKDAVCVIDDWGKLDEFIEKLPCAENDERWADLAEIAHKARADDRYLMFAHWNFFFERPWMLRGMANLMLDYYLNPDKIQKLHEAMCNVYIDYIQTAHDLLKPDGYWTSDDLGHQTGPMMGLPTFHDLLLPYYKRVGSVVRDRGMHFWLHSCGNNTSYLPDLIDAGVTVFHPVQKHTMDEAAIAAEFGDRLTFLAGFDVQHILVEGTPDQVREEVRFLMDTFDRPDGGMCIAAGNGIVGGTPFENIEAFLDEAVRYGSERRRTPDRTPSPEQTANPV